MPRESRLFVKAGLVCFALTFLLGGLLLALPAFGIAVPAVFAIEHAHLGLVGWLVNLVMGIALWMLPLNRTAFPATQGRYPRHAAFVCFALLNAGLLLRIVVEPWYLLGGRPPAGAILLALAAVAQFAAACVFVSIAWRRVRAPAHPAPGVS